jgi:hypothetical protein
MVLMTKLYPVFTDEYLASALAASFFLSKTLVTQGIQAFGVVQK